jgi:hypothetical protein
LVVDMYGYYRFGSPPLSKMWLDLPVMARHITDTGLKTFTL